MGAPKGGPGWGGSAKGAGNGSPGKPFGAGNQMSKRRTEPEVKAEAERDNEIAEEMCDFYVEVKRNPTESTINRIAAADKWLERKFGKAQQRQIISGDANGDPVRHAVVIIPAKSGE